MMKSGLDEVCFPRTLGGGHRPGVGAVGGVCVGVGEEGEGAMDDDGLAACSLSTWIVLTDVLSPFRFSCAWSSRRSLSAHSMFLSI